MTSQQRLAVAQFLRAILRLVVTDCDTYMIDELVEALIDGIKAKLVEPEPEPEKPEQIDFPF